MTDPSDPQRLADGPSGSPLGELLASASRDLPSDRELSALAGQLGGVLDAPPPPSTSAPGSSRLVKWSVVGGVAALIAGGAVSLFAPKGPSATVPSARVPSATVSGAALSSATVSGAALPLAPSASAAHAISAADPVPSGAAAEAASVASANTIAPSARKAPSPDAFSEAALLEQARHALSSAPATALALTAQHATRFPHGVLAQEREVIAIEALRRLHRTSEAERRAAAFDQAFPGSAHQRRVDEATAR